MSKEIIDIMDRLVRRVEKERRVLIVDDSPFDLEVLSHLFAGLGCACQGSESCFAALTKLSQKSFDICVLDMRMPKVDGLACARKIKANYPAVRIVICTGYPEGVTGDYLSSAGVLTLLSKPVQSEDLQRMFAEFNL